MDLWTCLKPSALISNSQLSDHAACICGPKLTAKTLKALLNNGQTQSIH